MTNSDAWSGIITGNDVRAVTVQMRLEVKSICNAVPSHIPIRFNVGRALADVATMSMNDIIEAAFVEFYVGKYLICEYAYYVASDQLQPWGPGAENPPLHYDFNRFPAGTQCRFTITVNPQADPEEVEELLNTLGWTSADPLDEPDDMVKEAYGTFVSGGYCVTRILRGSRAYRR